MDTLVSLAIFGVIVWLLLQLPMTDLFKQAIQILAILFVIGWLLGYVPVPSFRFPR